MESTNKQSANEKAIRLVHEAWMQVSGEPGKRADEASAKLHRIKRYLMTKSQERGAWPRERKNLEGSSEFYLTK